MVWKRKFLHPRLKKTWHEKKIRISAVTLISTPKPGKFAKFVVLFGFSRRIRCPQSVTKKRKAGAADITHAELFKSLVRMNVELKTTIM